MSASSSPPGAQQRFAAYLDSLAQAAEHADRVEPPKSYCKGLLLPGELRSVEPMAARLAPDIARQTHQSLHHFVTDAPWSDEALLEQVRHSVLPAMKCNGPVIAWIAGDTGFPNKGTHAVGATHQSCGQLRKQENCRVAVSLSMATEYVSLPIAWQLYLREEWAEGRGKRRRSPRDFLSNQAEDRPRTDSKSSTRGSSDGAGAGRCPYGDNTKFRERSVNLNSGIVGVRGPTTVLASETLLEREI